MADREVRVKLIVTGSQQAAEEFARMGVAAGAAGETIGRNLREGIEQGLRQAEGAADQSGNRIGDNIGDGIRQGTREGTADAEAQAGAAGDSIGDQMGEAIKGAIAGAAIGAAIVSAMSVEDGNVKLQAQLGLTAREAGQAGRLAGDLFTGNYAESMDEARDLVRSTYSAFGEYSEGFTDSELAKFAGFASNIAVVTGEEADSAIQAVSRMVRTGLVRNVEEGFDVLTRASQKTTAGMQGDLIDVGTEYAGIFAQVGFSGSQAFELLAEASKDGAIQMDKVGDSVKEFTLLATNLDDTGEAYERLGLDGEAMAARLLAGGTAARSALGKIIDGLLAIKNPTEQAALAISFFGTPIEDLGTDQIPTFLESLQNAEEGLGDFRGTASEVDALLGSTMSGRFSTLQKEAMGVGTAFGESLLPALEALMPVFQFVGQMLSGVGTVLGELPGWATAAALGIGIMGVSLRKATTEAGSFRGGLANVGKALAKGGLLAGGLIIFGLIGDEIAEAKRKQEEYTTAVEGLSEAIYEAGGAWDEYAQKQYEAEVEGSTTFQRLRAAGFEYGEIMGFLAGETDLSGEAMDRFVATTLGGSKVATTELIEFQNRFSSMRADAESLAQQKLDYRAWSDFVAELSGGMAEVTSAAGSAAEALKAPATVNGLGLALDEIAGKAGSAAEALEEATGMSGAFDTLADSIGDTDDELNFFIKSLELLEDGQIKVDDAAAKTAKSIRDIADSATKAEGETRSLTEIQEDNRDAILEAARAAKEQVAVTFQQDLANVGLEQALINAAAATDNQSASILEAGKSAGIAEEDTKKWIDQIGLTPDDVPTQFRALIDQAKLNGESLVRTYNTADGTWTASFMTEKEIAEAQAVGLVEKYDDATGTFRSTLAATDLASDVVNAVKLALNGIPSFKTVTIGATLAASVGQAGAAIAAIGGYTGGLFTGSGIRGFAGGGVPSGYPFAGVAAPRDPKADNILVGLANGGLAKIRPDEFLVNATSSRKYRDLLWQINQDRVPGWAYGGMPAGSSGGASAIEARVTFPGAGAIEAILRQYARVEIHAHESEQSRRAVGR